MSKFEQFKRQFDSLLTQIDVSKNKAVKLQDFNIWLFYRILQAGDHYKNKILINSVPHFHVF